MGEFWSTIKEAWADMLQPPWRHSDQEYDLSGHWIGWLIGWAWALAGLALGAVYAPSLVQVVGLAGSPYEGWLVIAVAVTTGFVVQLLGWILMFFVMVVGFERFEQDDSPRRGVSVVIIGVFFSLLWVVAAVLPIAGVGYGLYLYFTQVGADQRTITIAFVGGLLVKTFLIPFIKSLVTGAAFKVLMSWLRGGKKKSA